MSEPVAPKIRRVSDPGYTGLKNIGLTCFMNVVVQVLSNTVHIKEFFDNNCQTDTITQNSISYHLRDTICKLWNGRSKYFSPKPLVNTILSKLPQFEGDENDSHEFFMALTSELHDELKQPVQDDDIHELETSIIRRTFFGLQNITVKCTICDYETQRTEIFDHLSLALPQEKTTIKDLIRSHFLTENLEGFKCPNCHNVDTCTSSATVTKSPNVLVLCLKRLLSEVIDGEYIMSKNRVKVRYPLRNLQFGGKSYNLYAVILHSAEEQYDEYGHYYNYCKNHCTESWVEYDDKHVCEVDDFEILEPNRCCMLFYDPGPRKQKIT